MELTAEQTLSRYCFVLSLFEEAYRNPSVAYQYSPLLIHPQIKSLEELLAIPQDVCIDDLCALSWLFYDNYHDLLSRPFVLNPTFQGSRDVGGADADLIVNDCLVDIKASKQATLEPDWLRQIAGYVLLDYNDNYHIQSVGIYMARQGFLFTWPVYDFFCLLTGDNAISLAQLRQEFQLICSSNGSRRTLSTL